ncbi:MAG: ABC transporter permease subunit [Rhodospirillaceae bacterium]|nr:MAG: ABC transporter permease subunit [Rhodospirillaceae bacterium]
MFEILSQNRAAISAVFIIVLALALVASITFGLRDSARRRSDEVFGDPLRTTNGWYWAVAGVCSLLLVWYYFSWGAARAYFPQSANEICQVARVDEALSPINASLPTGARFYKSTTLLSRNSGQLDDIVSSLSQQGFSAAEEAELRSIVADIRLLMVISSDPARQSMASITGFEQIEDRLLGLAEQLGNPVFPTAAQVEAATAEAAGQSKWGLDTVEVPLLPETAKGVRFKLIADDLAAVASDFSKIRNTSPTLLEQTEAIKVRLDDFKARASAVTGLSEEDEDARAKTIKNIDRLYKRFDDGTIFPPNALDGIEAAIAVLNAQKLEQQGSLRLIRATMFGGGTIVKAKTQCSEQGAGRWLPKPTDVLATFGRIANPEIGFKDVPLIWVQWVPIADVVGFFIPDWIADVLPGAYPRHGDDGSVTPNFKMVVLIIAQGDFASPSIPMLTGHMWDSIFRVLMGLFFGIVLGVPLGIAMGVSRFFKNYFDPLIELYRPVPPLAWAPLILTIFGIQDDGKIFLLFIVAFAIMVISARTGATGTQLSKIRASHSLGATQGQIMRRVILPNAMPEILTGIRIAIGVCWGTLVAAEMLAGTTGIGFVENVARKTSDYEVIWVTILVLGLLGLLFDLVMRFIIARTIPWRGKG